MPKIYTSILITTILSVGNCLKRIHNEDIISDVSGGEENPIKLTKREGEGGRKREREKKKQTNKKKTNQIRVTHLSKYVIVAHRDIPIPCRTLNHILACTAIERIDCRFRLLINVLRLQYYFWSNNSHAHTNNFT